MSQSRFSIVLVGVSALLRRPLVSRLRSAAFTARGSGGFRRSALPSLRRLPLGGLTLPLGGLAFGLTASAFRHAPLRGCRSAGWPSGLRLPLFGTHRFGVALGGLALLPSVSAFATRRVGASAFRFGVALVGLVLPPSASAFAARRVGLGLTASAFRHAPLRSCPRRVGLRAHCFRFSARADSEWPLGGWPSGLLLRRLPFGGLAFGFTASAFRHAPLRRLPSAGWPSGSPLPLFGMRRSAPPHRRSEGRRSTPTRHLFHFKTLISTC